MTDITKVKFWFIRKVRFEYWPFWLFYFPAYFYGLFLALKAKSFSYFTTTNPSMKFSGAFGMSKIKALKQLPGKYKPVSVLVNPDYNWDKISDTLQANNLTFPLIAKPDIGERGKGVEKINKMESLVAYLKLAPGPVILQEFIDYPLELGILYYKYPKGKKDAVSSVVIREFLTITGDGVHNLEELINKNQRAHLRLLYLKAKFKEKLGVILKKGEKLKLEPIGNHNRGTKFLSGQHLINDSLVIAMREVTARLDGFYYGRLDLKVKSIEELYDGKGIKVLEINGVNSEPAHIYDPATPLLTAWKTVFKHMKIIYRISQQQRAKGYMPVGVRVLLKAVREHFHPGDHPKNIKKSHIQSPLFNVI